VTDVLQARGSHDSLVIIDNPHPDHTRELIAAAVAGDGPKLIITIANPRAVQTFNFGQDARVKTLRLQPLTEPESRELLRSAGAELDYSVESWVIQKAGVNPSILIAAAAVGKKLRVTGPRFLDQLGDELEARARDVLGDVGVKIIRCVSMMTALGISGPVAEELTTVCGVFGDVTPNHVLSNIPRLAGSGFIRQIGNYLEASPPVLANRAARLFLAGREKQLGVLLSGLPSHARVRLLRRIQQLPGEAIEAFIAELFHDGPLQNFERALSDF
jgi:hypothetical protein